jgi:hypothetical protein
VNVYYVAEVASVIRRAGAVPGEVAVRPAGETDIPELARLYLRAYDPPAVRTLDEAVAEMTSSLDGTWASRGRPRRRPRGSAATWPQRFSWSGVRHHRQCPVRRTVPG